MKYNDEFGITGNYELFDSRFDLRQTRIAHHILFRFFNPNTNSVDFGFSSPFTHIEENVLSEVFSQFYALENSYGLINLTELIQKTKGELIQKGVLMSKIQKINFEPILPYHHLLYEGMTVYSVFDSYMGNFIMKIYKNINLNITIKFSKDCYHLDIHPFMKKAFWNAPLINTFEQLNETPVAYTYNSPELELNPLSIQEFDQNNPIDRIEFYWKKLNKHIWQIEIEKLRNRSLDDYPDSFGMKYFHAVYDQELKGFVHMDAAVRVYNINDFYSRYKDRSLDIKTFGKNQNRIKVMSIDINHGHDHKCVHSCKTNHNKVIIKFEDFYDFCYIWFEQDPVIKMYFENING